MLLAANLIVGNNGGTRIHRGIGDGTIDVARAYKLGAILLIALVGLIHLVEAPEYLEEAPYIGWSFLVLVLGTLLAIVGIDQGARWGWLLGVLLSGIAFVAFVISRTLGLPGFTDDIGNWEPMGIYALFVEALFIALYLIAPRERNRRG